MVDILHRVGVISKVDAVYEALTTIDGLAGWWTRDTSGAAAKVGDVVKFRFTPGGFDMKVVEVEPGAKVLWEVVDGPEEWIGTHVIWDLEQEGEYATIRFKHRGWREPVDFMHHCSTKWATYLMSLKELVETGKGRPDPDDVKIDSWN